ncbi:patatin-like phospholipase [Gluconacetobacter liquefaciens]|nr:patatin-like phospholipase [Gluconacetobacter liquefaciens]
MQQIYIEYNNYKEKDYYTSQNIGIMQKGKVSFISDRDMASASDDHFILSIDGGGIFGIIPIMALQDLAQCLQSSHGSRDLYKYFDVIAGNSTGAIIAAGLVTPKGGQKTESVDINEIYDLYARHGAEIFPEKYKGFIDRALSLLLRKALYDNTGRKKILHEKLQDHTSNEALTDFVIPFYDTTTGPIYFTRNHGSHSYEPDGALSQDAENAIAKMVDIAMYSSSAPIYFNPYKGDTSEEKIGNKKIEKFYPYTAYDGALYQNNPALLGIVEGRRDFPHGRFHIVSLGTGISYRGSMLGPLDPAHPASQKSNINLISALLPSFMEGNALGVDEFLRSEPNIDYIRIDVPLNSGMDLSMDNPSQKHIDDIRASVIAASSMNRPIIQKVCRKLISYRPSVGQ